MAINRAQGCWLGQLTGDALGSLVEFQSPGEIRRLYPEGVRYLADGGTWGTISGQPTDDSELALMLARLLVERGTYQAEAALGAYRVWLASGPFDCGLATAQGLEGRPNPHSQANGALMRISPLGIFGARHPLARVGEWARQDAALTHPHPVCQQANALFAMAIALAIKTGPRAEALYEQVESWAVEEGVDPTLLEIIRAAASGPPADYVERQGWVLTALGNGVASPNPALLVGNPTYGRPGERVAQANTRTIDLKNRIFPALPGTQVEVEEIADQLPGARLYTATNATEALIKQQAQPSILHIATHGFFTASGEIDPLLQSGLILAGAAEGQSGPDQDGLLTALEVTGLNLRGTQLVVLSACETGLGQLATGEGVYGLRRAFVLAGAQSQVISLWKVDDTATQAWMVDYYDRLLSGTPRDLALHQTQQAFLNNDQYRHPYYWAAFIGSGDWRPLQR